MTLKGHFVNPIPEQMKKLLLCLSTILILWPARIPVLAQEQVNDFAKKERRIFLWDVTISMVGATQNSACVKGTKRSKPSFDYANSGFPYYNKDKDIFDTTRETLLKLIDDIKTESTEIIVLPFRNDIVGEFKAFATAEGKDQLRKQIMGWDDLQVGGTFTGTCLEKAIRLFTEDKKNQVVLLTDGEPSGNEGTILLNILKAWKGGQQTRIKNRLVYVMLTQEAEGELSQVIKDIADNSDGQISVITPKESIAETVYIILGNKTSLHVRDFASDGISSKDGSGTIGLSYTTEGPAIPRGYSVHVTVEENDFVIIDADVSPENGKFTIPFRLKKNLDENLASLPLDSNLTLVMNFENNKDFPNVRIVDGYTAGLELVLRPEPRVSISWSLK